MSRHKNIKAEYYDEEYDDYGYDEADCHYQDYDQDGYGADDSHQFFEKQPQKQVVQEVKKPKKQKQK